MALIGLKSIYLRFPCGWPFIVPPAVRLTGGAICRRPKWAFINFFEVYALIWSVASIRVVNFFLVKAPMRRRHYAPPVSRTAGGAIKGTPQGNRRYILLNPIRAISDLTFLIFFKVLLPYIEFITLVGFFSKLKWEYTPMQSPLGTTPL